MNKLSEILATYFYLGRSPKMPGTVGTLGAIPLWLLLSKLSDVLYVTVVFFLVLAGVYICEMYERQNQKHDSQDIVIDEVAGYLITMSLMPVTWKSVLAGFILFRLFDILKPFPVGYLDKKIKGGMGVMADDIAAGIISSLILQAIYSMNPFIFS